MKSQADAQRISDAQYKNRQMRIQGKADAQCKAIQKSNARQGSCARQVKAI
jgi:hypothetical protein